jgi:hypothetical protein
MFFANSSITIFYYTASMQLLAKHWFYFYIFFLLPVQSGQLQLKHFGQFIDQHQHLLKNLLCDKYNSNGENNDGSTNIIGLDFSANRENLTLFQLIESDNKVLNKIMLGNNYRRLLLLCNFYHFFSGFFNLNSFCKFDWSNTPFVHWSWSNVSSFCIHRWGVYSWKYIYYNNPL